MRGRGRHVVVLSHAALPRTQAGGTRHIELFGRLREWTHVVVASNRSNYTRQKYDYRGTGDPTFVTVRTPTYGGNGFGRVLNWLSYCAGAVLVGIRQRDVGVVYGSSPHLLAPLAGLVLARLKRAAFVLEVRDLWPRTMVDMGYLPRGSLLHRILVRMEGMLYRAADRVVVTTESYRGHVSDFGVPADRVEVISNGAEPDDFVPTISQRQARAALGVDGFVALYAGAHGPANGLDQVLDAASELPDCTFVLIGDGLEKERLQRRAIEERLDNVRFLAPVPRTELADIFCAADVGLHVLADVQLFHEGISSNKLYDYLAAGLPALSNVRGEPSDVLTGSGAGLSCPPDGLVTGLGKMRTITPAERAEMGEQGRAYVRQHTSRTVMAAKLQRVLDTVAE